MNTNNKNLEKIMSEALELKEKGKTISEILDLYPEYKKELKEMFQIIDILSREKEKILPSKELLTKIISELTLENSITEKDFSRYLYRGEKMPDFSGFKGRPSILKLLEKISLLIINMKKIYLGIGILVLALVVVAGIYWQSQKVAVSPMESEISFEEQALEQDISNLEGLEKDQSLNSLEQDLNEITQEASITSEKKIDITSIENLESELSLELSGISTDLNDLSGFESDASLGDLDTGLSGI